MATENKDLSSYDPGELPNTKGLRFGIVVSEWNEQITSSLFQGARATLLDCGVAANHITSWQVPGSFELLFGCKKMIATQKVDAVIAIGSVIRGETAHFEYVCSAVAQGIKDLNVNGEVPVVFCVLTDDTLDQAIARSGGKHGNKGVEAAVAAIKMAVLGK